MVEEGEVFSIFSNPQQDITKDFLRTTSNLQKIEELLEAGSPVTRLQPGEIIVRLTYVEKNVSEPLISTVSRQFNINLNIIFANIEIVQNAPIGGTVAIVTGEPAHISAAIQYLKDKNVGVEVIADARLSE
ncbi:Methionine import ATP-binding protein MetN [compost metagenome]